MGQAAREEESQAQGMEGLQWVAFMGVGIHALQGWQVLRDEKDLRERGQAIPIRIYQIPIIPW